MTISLFPNKLAELKWREQVLIADLEFYTKQANAPKQAKFISTRKELEAQLKKIRDQITFVYQLTKSGFTIS